MEMWQILKWTSPGSFGVVLSSSLKVKSLHMKVTASPANRTHRFHWSSVVIWQSLFPFQHESQKMAAIRGRRAQCVKLVFCFFSPSEHGRPFPAKSTKAKHTNLAQLNIKSSVGEKKKKKKINHATQSCKPNDNLQPRPPDLVRRVSSKASFFRRCG